MLNRIFKTILVLSLCIGISLPTNAAVSVSDGSAFVTKAEFAADLNNLSNRMAQLENSLDAKIDSLVSSYLTRNGIWNGARQEVVSENITNEFWPLSASLSGGNYTINSFLVNKEWMSSVGKSGMLSTLYKYKNKSGVVDWSTQFGYEIVTASTTNFTSDNGMTLVFEVYKDSVNDSNLIFSSTIFSITATLITTGSMKGCMSAPLPSSYVLSTFSVFVSKGDKIIFCIREIARFRNLKSASIVASNNANSKLVFSVDDSPFIY